MDTTKSIDALCEFLGQPYRAPDGSGLWGYLRQKEREFQGWDQDGLLGMLIERVGLWRPVAEILEAVNEYTPIYGGAPLEERELHRARLGLNTLGRRHLWRHQHYLHHRALSARNAAPAAGEERWLAAVLPDMARGEVGVILTQCICAACEPEDWRLFDLFAPEGEAPDLMRADCGGYTPVALEALAEPDRAIVESSVYMWVDQLRLEAERRAACR
jgi:hypothetical protein